MSVRCAWRIGLTGGIGSGKSTVGARWKELGADLIDADAIARSVTAPGGAAIASIARAFGAQLIDSTGALDRARMRTLAFADAGARTRLEAIVHPLVGRAIADRVRTSESACIVFDIPLLIESPRWRPQLDRVVVVDCTEATQIRRVHGRSGWDEATVRSVIAHQCTRVRRLAAADAVLFNDADDIDRLHVQVDRLSARFGL